MNSSLPLAAAAAFVITLSACSEKSTQPPAAKTEARTGAVHAAITPETAQRAGIEVLTAGPGEIRETLQLFGAITANAERRQEIRARYAGVVRTVAKRPGESVARNELLLSVESNDSLEPYPIRSPIAGTVLERHVNAGESIDGGKTLMVVADLSTVWAEFAVFSRDLSRVHAGQSVLLEAAENQAPARAQIVYVAPSGERDSQSIVARAVVENRAGRWVTGQFVTGDVVIADVKAAVTVAPAALQTLNGKSVVFVAAYGGFEPRVVVLGKRAPDIVEIVSGLQTGERYAAKNSYLIKSELLKGSGEE